MRRRVLVVVVSVLAVAGLLVACDGSPTAPGSTTGVWGSAVWGTSTWGP